MRQTIFYLPTQIAGYPLFGTGILFWAILIVGLITIFRSLVLRKNVGDAIFYALLTGAGLLVARYVGPNFSESEGFPVRGYGIFLTIAIATAGGVALLRGKKKWNYPSDILFTVLFVAAFFGIIGARVFYVAQYWHDYQYDNLRDTILAAINITNGGLVVYGSIIGGTLATIIYLLVKKLPMLATLDLLYPSVMLGVAIGRIGCLMNGCCFGGVCDLPWAVSFPPGSPAYLQQLEEGNISLFGITLAPAEDSKEEADDEKTLFSIKTNHANLISEIPTNVTIFSVDPGSAAEEAGIKPGDRILEMGVVPQGLLNSEDAASSAFERRKIERFRAVNNAQVFFFFFNIWDEHSDDDVLLVLQSPNSDDAKDQPAKVRNVVFHPTSAKALPVHPTQIYSSVNAFVIFLILLVIARFAKRDGVVVGWGFVLYPINRFFLELIRTDEGSFHGTGLTIAQCISVGVILFGAALLLWAYARPPKMALENFFPAEDPQNLPAASKDEKV
ncbi:MAG: prolipoprotein diacylglyceryl transferase family protein [Thermoguttaceae bacterium]|jgi:phosphatidylglycerol:prolipoprotein diacylglycerol transferase